MDIKQAKLILIILFLIINIVLLGIIVFSENENKVSRTILDNVMELFEKNEIVINCELPDNMAPVPQLNMGEKISIGRVAGVDLDSTELSFETNEYELMHEFRDFNVYTEKYKGSIVLENRINMYEDSMEYVNREIIGFDSVKKSIMPAYAILLKEYLNSDVKSIDKIQMVYIKYLEDDIIGPVWFIQADGEVRYFYAFEAFSGLEMPNERMNAILGSS